MGFQQIEFEFPEGDNDDQNTEIEIEPSSAVDIDEGDSKVEVEKVKKAVESTDDNLEVEVVDDTPKKDRGRKAAPPPEEVTEDELESYSEKVRSRIKHFSKGYHDERRAKEAALREREELEAYARKLMQENEQLKGSANKSQAALIEQAKRNVAIELETAKNEYKRAYDSGNADSLLEAQEKLTSIRLKAEKLAAYRAPALQSEDSGIQQESKSTQRTAPADKPAPQRDERALSWADENPWFGSDDEMTSFALGYHQKLVKQGVDPTADEYYEKINARMRQVFPDEFEDTIDIEDAEVSQPKRKNNVVAPATRSTAPKKIRLTQTQVNLAKRLGLTPQQYAKQVAEDMRNSNG